MITRFEVIDDNGRMYVKKGEFDLELSFQDDDRTVKVFITPNQEVEDESL